MDVFISHASEDKPIARRLAQDLTKARISVWIDHANIRVGDPLADRIQEAIENATTLVLLWSASASESRYVKLEWQAAIHLGKAVIPCRLDQTDLPIFLRTVLFCDFRDSYAHGLRKLVEALGGVLPLPQPQPHERPPVLDNVIVAMHQAQQEVIIQLVQQGPSQAAEVQVRIDPLMEKALGVGGHDPMILNLAGYHKKNAYMIKHWVAIQKGMAPQDELLEEAERFFYSALSIRPDDPSALNGLGSVLMLRRDLDAAAIYIRTALARTQEEHRPYPAAEHDLRMVLRLKNAPQR